MHAKALEIAWHQTTPVWSVDISNTNRLVTAGGDKVARIWRLHPSTNNIPLTQPSPPTIDWLCDLRAHLTTVNVARFNPTGLSIATAADHGEIILWRFAGPGQAIRTSLEPTLTDNDPTPSERWTREATLRGHVQDVLDLAWGSDGYTLVSASVDNSVMIWDTRNPTRPPTTLRAHANFVQGVAIDPIGKLIASLGNDRTLRVFSKATQSGWSPVAALTSLTADAKLFVDEAKTKTFFRRLTWSPDGSVVACPAGLQFPQTKRLFAVHVFARFQWSQPAVQCGGLPSAAVAVRFSPVLYGLRRAMGTDVRVATPELHSSAMSQSSCRGGETGGLEGDLGSGRRNGPFEGFLYRMVFAVACVDAVLFYDTESFTRPFARVEGLHCAEQTDLAWSADGLQLAVASVDGYVSVVSFEEGELGKPLREEELPRWLREYSLSRQDLGERKMAVNADTKILVKPTRKKGFVEGRSPTRPDGRQSFARMARPVGGKSPTRHSCPKHTSTRPDGQGQSWDAEMEKQHVTTGAATASGGETACERDGVTVCKTAGQGYRISGGAPMGEVRNDAIGKEGCNTVVETVPVRVVLPKRKPAMVVSACRVDAACATDGEHGDGQGWEGEEGGDGMTGKRRKVECGAVVNLT